MLFNSAHYLLFFPIVTLMFFLIPIRYHQLRLGWLLICSYYFYMCWNAVYALLMLGSTIITYLCGILIGHHREKAKYVLLMSLILNLGILFFFKYQGFAAYSITRLVGLLGINWKIPTVDVLLPVGISFYTFQAVGYTIDVYHGDIEPEKNFVAYAVFVSFFPQLVAGPIERSGNLLYQIHSDHTFDYDRIQSGLWLMLWGFFQKVVIADRLAVIVDIAYNAPQEHSSMQLIVATLAFAIQIYCDFASYSNIAIGTGRILGINLMKNFSQPYFSASIAEFWRRWHISLSTWLRDYVYIPLGGNRKGTARKNLNLIIVFLISGLWHGASWNFVIWGAIHGLYQVIGGITKPWRDAAWQAVHIDIDGKISRFVKCSITFLLVNAAWIFFRANSVTQAITVVRQIAAFGNVRSEIATALDFGKEPFWLTVTICSVLVLVVVSLWERRTGEKDCRGNVIASPSARIAAWPVVLRWAVALSLLMIILLFGAWETVGFIYFQF